MDYRCITLASIKYHVAGEDLIEDRVLKNASACPRAPNVVTKK